MWIIRGGLSGATQVVTGSEVSQRGGWSWGVGGVEGGQPPKRLKEKGPACLPDAALLHRLTGFRQAHADQADRMVPERLAVGACMLPVLADCQHLLKQLGLVDGRSRWSP